MMILGLILVYSLYELLVSKGLVQASLSMFRLVAVVTLFLMVLSHRTEVYVGAALFFGVITMVCLWAFRSEVQEHDLA